MLMLLSDAAAAVVRTDKTASAQSSSGLPVRVWNRIRRRPQDSVGVLVERGEVEEEPDDGGRVPSVAMSFCSCVLKLDMGHMDDSYIYINMS